MRRLLNFGLVLLPLTLLPAAGCNKQQAPTADASSLGTAHQAKTWSESRADERRPPSDGFGDAGRPAGGFEDDRDHSPEALAAEDSRPGLGTAYGETRRSSVESVGFRRADPNTPDVVFTIRYDDVDGVRSAARTKRTQAWADDALQQHSGLSFALLDERGRILPAAMVGSQRWAVGSPDSRYSLAIANDTSSAFEVVGSVDGLDIIDGRPASLTKRGYIVDPFSSVVIDGWRTSESTIAAFRFSSIEDSYAERMGDGRNVGVIGAAFFRQAPAAWDEWRPAEETWRRDTANPFPAR